MRRLLKLGAGLALFSLLPAMLAAQADGGSPAVRRAREIVAVINSADPTAIRAYVDSAFGPEMRRMPMPAHLNFVMGTREQSRGLDWLSVQDQSAIEATALLKRRLTGDRTAILVRVE